MTFPFSPPGGAAPSVLQGLQNPPRADILGGLRQGQQEGREDRSREAIGKIIGASFGGQLAALGKDNPDAFFKIAKGFNIPLNETERLKAFVGTIQAATALANGPGGADAAAALIKEHRDTIRTLNPAADTSNLDEQIEFLKLEPESGTEALNLLTDSFIEQGILVDPATKTGTASSKDFQTLQTLRKIAEVTGDPADIQRAEEFGRQAGFERVTPQEQAEIDIQKSRETEAIKSQAALETTAGKAAIKKSGEFFDQIGQIREANLNVEEAIRLLQEEGAASGPIISRFPSIKASAVKLDNVRRKMGLDIIGAVTFGALSKGELDLALATAIPLELPPSDLISWLERRKSSQEKLSNYYEEAASFLGTPGNTIPKFIKQQKARKQVRDATPEETPTNVGRFQIEVIEG